MTQKTKILLGLDPLGFSLKRESSFLKNVFSFAKTIQAEILVTGVLTLPDYISIKNKPAPATKKFIADAQKLLEESRTILGAKTSVTITLRHVSDSPNPAETFIRFAKKTKAHFIAVSTHNQGVIKKWFLGSFADAVIRHAHCPLFVVPVHTKNTQPQKLNRIVHALTFKKGAFKISSNQLHFYRENDFNVEFTHGLQSEFIPWAVSDSLLTGGIWAIPPDVFAEEEKNRIHAMSHFITQCHKQHLHCSGKIYTQGGSIAEILMKETSKSKFDLIAIETKMGSPGHISLGSVTRKLVTTSVHPLIIWKA